MALGFRGLAPADDLHEADYCSHGTQPDPEQRFYIHQVQHGPFLLSFIVGRLGGNLQQAGSFLSA
jgi:hypothetical protein